MKKTCQRMALDEQLGTDGSGTYYYLSRVSPVSPEGQQGQEGRR